MTQLNLRGPCNCGSHAKMVSTPSILALSCEGRPNLRAYGRILTYFVIMSSTRAVHDVVHAVLQLLTNSWLHQRHRKTRTNPRTGTHPRHSQWSCPHASVVHHHRPTHGHAGSATPCMHACAARPAADGRPDPMLPTTQLLWSCHAPLLLLQLRRTRQRSTDAGNPRFACTPQLAVPAPRPCRAHSKPAGPTHLST